MDDSTTAPPAPRLDPGQFREVVRDPRAHAFVLGQYRVGEYAGVVALRRLLGEMAPEGKLRRAMEIHYRDEERHSRLFTDWMRRLGTAPPALPTELEGYFSNDPEEFRRQRELAAELPPELRRILVFAGINAIERLAYEQFEIHLLCLERREDVEAMKSVMVEEKFHLSYVESELEAQEKGDNGAFVAMALEQARARFKEFQDMRRRETRAAVERILGGPPTTEDRS
jgi:hypothetical protein